MARGRNRWVAIVVIALVPLCLFLGYERQIDATKRVFTISINPTYLRGLSPSEKLTQQNTNPTELLTSAEYENTWLKDVLKLHQKFKRKTSESCNNTCAFETEVCEARRLEQWERILTSGKITAVPLFSSYEEAIFPWEKEYLSQPSLKDSRRLPDLRLSKVYHLTYHNNSRSFRNVVKCKNNDILIFRADLKDGYGDQREYGGDEVRAWITNGSLTMTVSVRDEGNGTYLITVTPVWEGTFSLHVAVVYPREYLRAALHHMKEGRHRFIFGLFEKGSVSEVTICHTTPNIPGRPCVCNYTTWNRGPYYCGKPLDSRLSCKDWRYIRPASGPIAKDFTHAEAAMAAVMARPLDDATIKCDIVIEATETDTPVDRLSPPCVQYKNRTMTWNHESPRGFWVTGREWQSFRCREPPLTSAWVASCLHSTSIWMIGDSNLNRLYKSLRRYVTFQYPSSIRNPWPVEQQAINVDNNITVTFRGHEYPLFYYTLEKWTPVLNQGGIEDFISKIPSTGEHVVIIHYNLHFAVSHLSAIFQRLLSVKKTVKDLLQRNPSVLVVIRGPHISSIEWKSNHLFGGDVQGGFILRILNVVFEDMKDKIVFLDGWDMTISLKNRVLHPPSVVTDAMLRTLLSFKCSF